MVNVLGLFDKCVHVLEYSVALPMFISIQAKMRPGSKEFARMTEIHILSSREIPRYLVA